jgi:DNA-binding MarR family transcriptional regulator
MMSKSNRKGGLPRTQIFAPNTMKHTSPSIVHGIVARAAEMGPTEHSADDLMPAAQLACARWLAGYRADLGLTVVNLVDLTGISPPQLLWIDLGLATPALLSPTQEDRFRTVLIGDQQADRHTLNEIISLTLGSARRPNPQMLTWVVDDLVRNVWRQPELEESFASYFTLTDTDEIEPLLKVLKLDELVIIDSLFAGEKDSDKLFEDLIRRRIGGRLGLDRATYAAMLDTLVTQGLVTLGDDCPNQFLDDVIRQLKLTKLGQQLLLLKRRQDHNSTPYKPTTLDGTSDWVRAILASERHGRA